MKKLIALALAAVMGLSLCACGGGVSANQVFSKDDLAGKTIGVQNGTTGDIVNADEYEKDHGSKIMRYNKGMDAVQALKQGKVDAVIIDAEPAKAYVSSNEGLKILDDKFDPESYAFCLKKGNTELTEAINGALKELKADGTLQSIVDNYIGENAGKTPYTSPENVDRSKGTLTMGTNATFPPYESTEGSKIVGIDPDIAQAICDKLGYSLEITDMEFDAIIPAVNSGKADFGAAGMTVTEERLQNVDFSDTYATSRQVIIVREK